MVARCAAALVVCAALLASAPGAAAQSCSTPSSSNTKSIQYLYYSGETIGVGKRARTASYSNAFEYGNHDCFAWSLRCSSSSQVVMFEPTEFDTEGVDDLYVYDGTSTSDTRLLRHDGGSMPSSPAYASSGREMYIVWDSDGSVTPSTTASITGWMANVRCATPGGSDSSCNDGEYLMGGAIDWCYDCPKGRYDADWSSSDWFECSDCPAGKYQYNPGQTSCYDCPSGRTSPRNTYWRSQCHTSSAPSCPAGQYKDAHYSTDYTTYGTCSSCSDYVYGPGYTSDGGTNAQCYGGCSAGTYYPCTIAADGSTDPSCDVGYGVSCVACPADTYMETSAHAEKACTPCPDGDTTDGLTGATSVDQCEGGGSGIVIVIVLLAVGLVCSAVGAVVFKLRSKSKSTVIQIGSSEQQPMAIAVPGVATLPQQAVAVGQPAPLPVPTLAAPPPAAAPSPAPLGAAPTYMPPPAPDLDSLSTKELRQKAEEMGIGPEAIELARDSDDPQAELKSLIVSASAAAPPTIVEDLSGLSTKELRQKAEEMGIDPGAVELARDSDDPKTALIALIQPAP